MSAGVATTGYVALEALKASQLYEEGAKDVPLWVWSPLAIMVIGLVAMVVFVLFCKSKTANFLKFAAMLFSFFLVFKYTVGFVFFG